MTSEPVTENQRWNLSFESPDALQLAEVLEAYLCSLERGEQPDRDGLIAAHPEIGGELAGSFAKLDAIQHAAAGLKGTQLDAAVRLPIAAAPERLGGFLLIREIGRGGMGVVYEAEQLSLGRRVALKVLPFAAVLGEKQLVRFKNEARAAGTLDHPHIVHVYSVGCERGVHFYAMQFIEGQSLAEVIHQLQAQDKSVDRSENSAVPVEQPGDNADTETVPIAALITQRSAGEKGFYRTVAKLSVQAAEALAHAHQHGVLHRDIKPANLLLDAHGNLSVTDFGLARIEADAGMTGTGDLLGTLRYMSPEQALGRRGLVDQRADVYSLGATLYELLTLKPIFAGNDRQALLGRIASEEITPPRKINPSIPVELETIALKATEKSPTDRYESAQDLADDLRRFLDHRPIEARRPKLIARFGKLVRRRRALSWTVAVALLSGGSCPICETRAA